MRIFLILILSIICNPVFSQNKEDKLQPFVEAGGGVATGISTNVYSGFLNASMGLRYSLSDDVHFNSGIGYVRFFRKSGKEGISFLPLKAGAEYFMASNLFLSVNMGGALLMDGSGSVYFLLEPGAGWQWSRHHSVRLSYQGFVTNGLIVGGIALIYRFIF